MKSYLAAALAASLSLAFGTGAAFACGGSTVLFSDDFSFADPNWGNYDGTSIENGVLTIAFDADTWYALENQAGFYTDFDVCFDVVQHNDDPTTAFASALFWGVDYDNFYTFDVATNGYIRVSRLQNGRWLTPVAWTLVEGLIYPGEESNQLRVVAQGNVATVFVNGQQVAKFRGQPPDGGGLLGVFGYSSTTAGASYDFQNFVVTTGDADLAAPVSAPEPAPGPDVPPPLPTDNAIKMKSN